MSLPSLSPPPDAPGSDRSGGQQRRRGPRPPPTMGREGRKRREGGITEREHNAVIDDRGSREDCNRACDPPCPRHTPEGDPSERLRTRQNTLDKSFANQVGLAAKKGGRREANSEQTQTGIREAKRGRLEKGGWEQRTSSMRAISAAAIGSRRKGVRWS